ncbi:hypothetical protein D3P07_08445 [Paenibacillus sp. 1011MAR3C5]|uniref:hypothetical protein n=1 Tax=Paenibacillus sp. 1011MAR3C5 TaxID=1675787 RepID=UPI000E6D449B|nr:hypothetical protein [Paenibacillus sp. 1011MAR3C5]RJE90229.1 hypothetical protein D3P07_08445 [Paenibacillus sp. 1011MAR3C5]
MSMNEQNTPLASRIEETREKLKHFLNDCSDSSIYHFRTGEQLPSMFVFFSGLTHEDRLDELRQEMAGWGRVKLCVEIFLPSPGGNESGDGQEGMGAENKSRQYSRIQPIMSRRTASSGLQIRSSLARY